MNNLFPEWKALFGESYMATSELLVDWILVIVALFSSVFIGYKISPQQRSEGFHTGTRWSFLYGPWLLLLRTLVPFAIVLVLAQRAQIL